jgi:hypothetical protein
MFRVSILKANSKVVGKNFNTREQCDEYILSFENVKKAIILNKETKEKEIIKF